MAEKRMFSNKIVLSDAFLDMPLSAQCLYFHLNMQADDEGFLNSPKKVMRIIRSNDDDLKILVAKNFVILFESGVIVIKHWRINNYLRKDRTNKTMCIDERKEVFIKENGSYTLDKNQELIECQPDVNHVTTECPPRLDKIRLVKDNVQFLHDTSLDIDVSDDVNKDLYDNNQISDVDNKLEQDAKEIINYLNEKYGSSYKFSDSSIKLIKSRLKDGYTKEQCKQVINLKIKQWANDLKMKKYIRPMTLFRKSKFEGYIDELMPIMSKAIVDTSDNEKIVLYDPITGEEVIL